MTAKTPPPDRPFAFRPLTETDLPEVVAWRAADHLAPWHSERLDLAAARAKYLPWITGEHPNHLTLVLAGERPCGYAWHYRVGDHGEYARATAEPGAVGIDIIVGDAGVLERGLGAALVRRYLHEVVFAAHPGASRIVSSPVAGDRAALRMLTDAGFVAVREITVSDGDPAETLCIFDPRH